MNNGHKCLIIGTVVRSEYSNFRYLDLMIGNVQKFVWSWGGLLFWVIPGMCCRNG